MIEESAIPEEHSTSVGLVVVQQWLEELTRLVPTAPARTEVFRGRYGGNEGEAENARGAERRDHCQPNDMWMTQLARRRDPVP